MKNGSINVIATKMSDYLKYRQQLKLEGKKEEKKAPNKIRQVSKKREKINREYAAVSHPIWKDQACAIKAPGCWGRAQGIHHKAGKSSKESLLDEKNMIAACNHCNSYVESHDAWARERGFKVSRIKWV